MFKIHKVLQDATLYQFNPDKNTGADQILELTKNASGQIIPSQINPLEEWPVSTSSRIVMKFADIDYTPGSKYQLMLNLAEIKNSSSQNVEIELAPIFFNWVEGVGNTNDYPNVTRGVSWSSPDGQNPWVQPYYDASAKITHTLDLSVNDYILDITPLFEYWNTEENHGFVIKFTDAYEALDHDHSKYQFFSKQTHTAWEPMLVETTPPAVYAGALFNPTTQIAAHKIDLNISNFRSSYHVGEHIVFHLTSRSLFKTKQYASTNQPLVNIALPETQYQIEDKVTGRIMVPFSSHNVVERSDDGYVVSFNTDNFYNNRYYRIKFKIISTDGNIYIKDHNYIFKTV